MPRHGQRSVCRSVDETSTWIDRRCRRIISNSSRHEHALNTSRRPGNMKRAEIKRSVRSLFLWPCRSRSQRRRSGEQWRPRRHFSALRRCEVKDNRVSVCRSVALKCQPVLDSTASSKERPQKASNVQSRVEVDRIQVSVSAETMSCFGTE